MKPLSECQLYTFVDTAYLAGRSPAEVARQLCAGGSDLIQLRAKVSTLDEITRLAEALLPVTRSAGVGLVVNDHWAVARAVGAEFCHLGQEDFFDAGYRQVGELALDRTTAQGDLQPGLAPPGEGPPEGGTLTGHPGCPRIGLSTHAPEQARRAQEAGPAYLAMGPVYATGTKPSAKPVTLDYVRWADANVTLPWFAIGGINLGTLDAVLEAGARRICVVSAILSAPDVEKACALFKARLSR